MRNLVKQLLKFFKEHPNFATERPSQDEDESQAA